LMGKQNYNVIRKNKNNAILQQWEEIIYKQSCTHCISKQLFWSMTTFLYITL
jgi:hypothetical protein